MRMNDLEEVFISVVNILGGSSQGYRGLPTVEKLTSG